MLVKGVSKWTRGGIITADLVQYVAILCLHQTRSKVKSKSVFFNMISGINQS